MEVPDQTQGENETVEDLRQKLNTANKELANKIEVIHGMEQTIIGLKGEIENLGKQVKERDLKLQVLGKEIESLKANSAGDNNKTSQLVDPAKSKKNIVSNDSLTKAINEKDETIEQLKKNIKDLQGQLNKESKNPDMLTSINKRTGNKFKSLEECFSLIEAKSDSLQRKNSRESPASSFGSNKAKGFSEELKDDLNDRIYEIEHKMKSQEKKFKSDIKEKEFEVDELNEEIESMKKSKTKDKGQIKTLEGKIEDLESELEVKSEEIGAKDKKIKDLIQRIKDAETELAESEKKVNQLNEELSMTKRKLEEAKLFEKAQDDLAGTVTNKQKAIETMKTKIETLNRQIDQVKKEKIQLQNDLKAQKEAEKLKAEENQTKNLEQKNKITIQEVTIRQLENELDRSRNKKYNEFEFRPRPVAKPVAGAKEVSQSIGNESMKPLKIACPNCHLLCESTEIQSHVNVCLDDGN